MCRFDWKRWSSLFVLLALFATSSCRKESPKDPLEESKDEKTTVTAAEVETAELVGSEDIAGEDLEDTGLKQELVEPVEIPPAPTLGGNLKGWKPQKNKKNVKIVTPQNKFPRDMRVLADVLSVRTSQQILSDGLTGLW